MSDISTKELIERLRELERALAPFASVGNALLAQDADDTSTSPWVTAPDNTYYGNQGLTFGDFRAAAHVLMKDRRYVW